MAGSIEIRPSIIIDEAADPAVALQIRTFDSRIFEAPGTFLRTLVELDESDMSGTDSLHERRVEETSLRRSPADLILDYFKHRFDVDSSFDTKTEAAIAEDPTHQRLIAIMRGQKTDILQVSSMKTTTRPNPNAESGRDAVRKARLSIYIGRVADYLAQQSSPESTAAPIPAKAVGAA